jgi:hypothetical protein
LLSGAVTSSLTVWEINGPIADQVISSLVRRLFTVPGLVRKGVKESLI